MREDAKVGQPFAEYLGRAAGDVVYDLEITPNRPDLNSVIGIAREISAVTGNPLKIPDVADRFRQYQRRTDLQRLRRQFASKMRNFVRVTPRASFTA